MLGVTRIAPSRVCGVRQQATAGTTTQTGLYFVIASNKGVETLSMIKQSGTVGIGADIVTQPAKRTNYRWVILTMLCLMALIIFMDRTNISVAAPAIMKEFGFSKTEMGLVFSVFAWAYSIGQIPGGWLGDRFGSRTVLVIIVAFWSLMTMITPLAIGLTSMLVIRFVFGLGEAGAWPTATRAMQFWFPKSERGLANGATHSAGLFATSVVPLVAVSLMSAFGWRSVFWIFGSCGLIWSVAWYFLYRNLPEQSKWVNAAEVAYIQDRELDTAKAPSAVKQAAKIPWKIILTSSNMWYLAFSYVAYNYISYFFYYWMPTYLVEHHHVTMQSMGWMASLPLAAGAIGSLSGGLVTDFVYKRTGKLKFARQFVLISSMVGAALFLIPAATVADPWSVVYCLAGAVFFAGLGLGPIWAVAMDISGGYSGSVSSVMNMVGQFGGSISAIVFGMLTQRGNWVLPFYITTGVLLVASLMWIFLINPERTVLERKQV
jgi:sugar phosphate permease